MVNNHSHYALLEHYLTDSSDVDWALATVVDKEGSSYRSPGAVMLVNNLGQFFGLVSGGCLEADIIRHAKQVFYGGCAAYVEYDMREENTYAAELGIGCKGKIGVLIQFLTDRHRTLLEQLYARLRAGKTCYLLQAYEANDDKAILNELALLDASGDLLDSTGNSLVSSSIPKPDASMRHRTQYIDGFNYSLARIDPPFNLWVFGGGADARPLVSMASQIGWRITVVDHRSAYARASSFPEAEQIIKDSPENYDGLTDFERIDAAVLMTHNLKLDAQWMSLLYKQSAPRYIGLLGPCNRRNTVREMTDIDDSHWFDTHVNGPAGLNIGGELPESIALSILAQCHAVLFGQAAESPYSKNLSVVKTRKIN